MSAPPKSPIPFFAARQFENLGGDPAFTPAGPERVTSVELAKFGLEGFDLTAPQMTPSAAGGIILFKALAHKP